MAKMKICRSTARKIQRDAFISIHDRGYLTAEERFNLGTCRCGRDVERGNVLCWACVRKDAVLKAV